jgi:endonuclease I
MKLYGGYHMKKLIAPAILVGLLAFSTGFVLIKNQNYQQVDAYSIANLPTTIDLNDNTETEIRNYYAGLNSLSENERLGTNLLKNLKPILANNQKYYSYDSNTKIWQMYEISDRDWVKSPASSTTYGTYDAVNNKLTNYQYGTNSDGKNNPYVHALYNNRNIENQAKAWGNHNQDGWGINQEHIWAKSHGFDTKGSDGTGGARGDPMHLWAGNGWANHEHSNYFFAYVDENRSYSDAGTKYNTAWGNLTGKPLNISTSNETVFEPQDSDKGDIARAIFYMAARYNYYSGSDSTGIDGNNPNLVLANNLSENSRTGTSSATSPFAMGLLSDLLAWNKLDPVDEYETHRNNLLYKNFTNNRNPFIDFPEWADAIWGTADLDGKNYDPTPTKAANPLTDGIGGAIANEPFDVLIDNLELKVGQEGKVSGHNADDDILWSVDDNTVVSLSKDTSHNNEEITVTALKDGNTVIRASAFSNGDLINKSINVKVSEDVVVLVDSISVSGAKTEFQVGDTFSSEGLVVTVTYNNGTTEVISSGYTVSSPDMSKEGKQIVTVTYEGKTATYEINVVKPAEEAKGPNIMLFVIVGGVALVLIIIIVIIIYANASKKGKKKMRSLAKKGVKKAIKNSKKNSR